MIESSPLLIWSLLDKHPSAGVKKKQHIVAKSSKEAEYRVVVATTAKVIWLVNLLRKMHITPSTKTIVYYDNLGAMYLSANLIFHSRMKHVAIDFHFVRAYVSKEPLQVIHVHSADQLADFLTKTLAIS